MKFHGEKGFLNVDLSYADLKEAIRMFLVAKNVDIKDATGSIWLPDPGANMLISTLYDRKTSET